MATPTQATDNVAHTPVGLAAAFIVRTAMADHRLQF
jgi:hypothetical protein